MSQAEQQILGDAWDIPQNFVRTAILDLGLGCFIRISLQSYSWSFVAGDRIIEKGEFTQLKDGKRDSIEAAQRHMNAMSDKLRAGRRKGQRKPSKAAES